MISLTRHAAVLPSHTFLMRIPHEHINVLHQIRMRMNPDRFETLVASIRDQGQQTPGRVIALLEKNAKEYLSEINQLWGTRYDYRQFRPVAIEERPKKKFYLFLIAGHRRLHAVRQLGIPVYYCELHFQADFRQALLAQFHENEHEEVSPDDQARFLGYKWRQDKTKNPHLTLSAFARQYSRTPEAIRKMLRFISLPPRVQALVHGDERMAKRTSTNYGILCELARLQEAATACGRPYSEDYLVNLAYAFVAKRKDVKATAHEVTMLIRELEGQRSMWDLTEQDILRSAERSAITGLEEAVRVTTSHMERVARFHENGVVHKIASPAMVAAVTRGASLIAESAPRIVEGIRGARGASEAKKAITKVR